MPQYEYECSSCGESFSEILKISEMDSPCKKPCPKCKKKKVFKKMSLTRIVDPFVLGLQKPSSSFKEVMSGIEKKGGPRVKKNLSGKY